LFKTPKTSNASTNGVATAPFPFVTVDVTVVVVVAVTVVMTEVGALLTMIVTPPLMLMIVLCSKYWLITTGYSTEYVEM